MSQALSKKLLIMSGLTSVTVEQQTFGAQAFSLALATKPSVAVGSKTAVNVTSGANTWKIDVGKGEDEDLIDDDMLLTEDDRKPVVPKAGRYSNG
jgi:hypothetical protein